MTGTLAYLLSRKKMMSIATGITGVSFNNNQIIFTFQDGTTGSISVPLPQDGISITSIQINEDNHLICTFSDGSTVDAGQLPESQGGLIQVDTFSNLPSTGNPSMIYLVRDQKTLYYWDNQYEKLPIASTIIDDMNTVTDNDIDSLFEDETGGGIEDNFQLATGDDIDSLFKESEQGDEGSMNLASADDIDSLFK